MPEEQTWNERDLRDCVQQGDIAIITKGDKFTPKAGEYQIVVVGTTSYSYANFPYDGLIAWLSRKIYKVLRIEALYKRGWIKLTLPEGKHLVETSKANRWGFSEINIQKIS